MRHYEMMVILRDTLEDDGAQALVEQIEQRVTDLGGEVKQTDFWGRRPFAYEIDHRGAGYYAVFDLELPPEGRDEIERQLKLHDDVVRLKTIRPATRVRRPKGVRPAASS
jgi:small subunit ribosomal protein S6